MWETVIVRDFIQEEQKLQFNSQVKVVISKQRELSASPKQAMDPEFEDKIIK